MSKASRLARPPSAGAGSKLPSPRKECPGTTARTRVLSVGEKLMRAGNDGILTKQKSLKVAAPLDKAQSENETQTLSQVKGDNVDMTLPKSRISPPKASSHHLGTSNSEY